MTTEMAGVALDTSVLVAALQSWHEAHPRASDALNSALANRRDAVLPLHSLLEAYAVMTRLPAPHRLSPADALGVLEGSLRESARVVALAADDGWPLLEELADGSVAGGAAYDAAIVASARKAGARAILTLNARHFERFAGDDLEIRTP